MIDWRNETVITFQIMPTIVATEKTTKTICHPDGIPMIAGRIAPLTSVS